MYTKSLDEPLQPYGTLLGRGPERNSFYCPNICTPPRNHPALLLLVLKVPKIVDWAKGQQIHYLRVVGAFRYQGLRLNIRIFKGIWLRMFGV